jgi:beta-lactamase regulating signal transducer with metallopeptidase domain
LAIGLWSLYAVVTLVLAIRFFSNIIKISSKMKMNTPLIIRMPNWFWSQKTLPHTFLTIFINETEYNNREIEAELYTHELTHVTQNTRWIFYRTIENRFWFNPIFYFLQKSHTTQPRISCRWESSERL